MKKAIIKNKRKAKALIFWQNAISPHQADLLNALSLKGYQVHLIVDCAIDKTRSSKYWAHNLSKKVELTIKPNFFDVIKISRNKRNIHVVSGFFTYKTSALFLMARALNQKNIFIYSEYFSKKGLKRRILYYIRKFLCFFYKKIKILAIGSHGVDFFKKMGFIHVYEFAYFVSVDELKQDPINQVNCNKKLKELIFVGRINQGKGIKNLVDAFYDALKIKNNIRLKIIGEGQLKQSLIDYTVRLGIQDKVLFCDFMPKSQVYQHIINADLLVLPSVDKEGWGVVINEAQMLGVPVICSDKVGACSFIRHTFQGEVFHHKNIEQLTQALLNNISHKNSQLIADYTFNKLSPLAGVKYFERIVKLNGNSLPYQEITPPWKEC